MSKRTPFNSVPLAFRLVLTPEVEPLYNQLMGWVDERMKAAPLKSKSQALSEIIVGLLSHYLGVPYPETAQPGAVTAEGLKEGLKAEILDELRGYIAALINNPEAASKLFEAAQSVENGDAVDDETLDNILSDIRGGNR